MYRGSLSYVWARLFVTQRHSPISPVRLRDRKAGENSFPLCFVDLTKRLASQVVVVHVDEGSNVFCASCEIGIRGTQMYAFVGRVLCKACRTVKSGSTTFSVLKSSHLHANCSLYPYIRSRWLHFLVQHFLCISFRPCDRAGASCFRTQVARNRVDDQATSAMFRCCVRTCRRNGI